MITIRLVRGDDWLNLHVDANHPVRVNIPLDRDLGYTLFGGAVDHFPGECLVGWVNIEDLAKQGETEIVVEGENEQNLVIPIAPYTGPEA